GEPSAAAGSARPERPGHRSGLPPGPRHELPQRIRGRAAADEGPRLQVHLPAVALPPAGGSEVRVDPSPELELDGIVVPELEAHGGLGRGRPGPGVFADHRRRGCPPDGQLDRPPDDPEEGIPVEASTRSVRPDGSVMARIGASWKTLARRTGDGLTFRRPAADRAATDPAGRTTPASPGKRARASMARRASRPVGSALMTV